MESENQAKTATAGYCNAALPSFPAMILGMKVIFSEGTVHHLKTMDMQTAPRVGEQIVVNDDFWIVKSVTHLPKQAGRNDNKTMVGWDDDRDADMTIHLKRLE